MADLSLVNAGDVAAGQGCGRMKCDNGVVDAVLSPAGAVLTASAHTFSGFHVISGA